MSLFETMSNTETAEKYIREEWKIAKAKCYQERPSKVCDIYFANAAYPAFTIGIEVGTKIAQQIINEESSLSKPPQVRPQ